MATAALQIAPANSYRLPTGGAGDNRAQISPTMVVGVHIADLDEDGQATITELGELPKGTKEIYVQHRMAGDFYCMIDGKAAVSAIGDTPVEAFRNALTRARRSA